MGNNLPNDDDIIGHMVNNDKRASGFLYTKSER